MTYLAPGWALDDFLQWPPDTFALTSTLLRMTGAYRYSVCPPDIWPQKVNWTKFVEDTALEWRQWLTDAPIGLRGRVWRSPSRLPRCLAEQKKLLKNLHEMTIHDLQNLEAAKGHDSAGYPDSWRACRALLTLHALADAASGGFGLPQERISQSDPTNFLANMLLSSTGSLSRLSTDLVTVLPKMRVPQVGLTVRSLSHHLTAHHTEVGINWRTLPWVNSEENIINILVYPRPFIMEPVQFSAAHHYGHRDSEDIARYFRFSSVSLSQDEKMEIIYFIEQSKKRVRRLHAIVFPELAYLSSELAELKQLIAAEVAPADIPMLIAGVRRPNDQSPVNRAVLSTYFAGKWYDLYQDKHHRWKINDSQIEDYRLGGVLGGSDMWWEDVHVPRRRLAFLAPNGWLTLCPLICEDLARLDPLSEILRGVGPSLLVVLLLDGPQLPQRWPARYASVLADDPGSSVLTVTSLGMAESCVPQGLEPKRTIASWKDARTGWRDFELDEGEKALLVTLESRKQTEYTADGRSDRGAASVFTLKGAYKLSPSSSLGTATEPAAGAAIRRLKATSIETQGQEKEEKNAHDLKELTYFSYLVDSLISAQDDNLRRYLLEFFCDRPKISKRVRYGSTVHEIVQRSIARSYRLLGSERGPAELAIFRAYISQLKKFFDGIELAPRKNGFNEECLDYWRALVTRATDLLERAGATDSRDHRRHKVVALSVLWGVHKRLSHYRGEAKLSAKGSQLMEDTEQVIRSARADHRPPLSG